MGWRQRLASAILLCLAAASCISSKPGAYAILEIADPAMTDAVKRHFEHVTIIDGPNEYGFTKISPSQIRLDLAGADVGSMRMMAEATVMQGSASLHMLAANDDASSLKVFEERDGRIALPDDSGDGAPTVLYVDPVVRSDEIERAEVGQDLAGQPRIVLTATPEALERVSQDGLRDPAPRIAVVVDRRIFFTAIVQRQDEALILSGAGLAPEAMQIAGDTIWVSANSDKVKLVEVGAW